MIPFIKALKTACVTFHSVVFSSRKIKRRLLRRNSPLSSDVSVSGPFLFSLFWPVNTTPPPPRPLFAHLHQGYAVLPNSESSELGWGLSCCTAPSEKCQGGTAAREGGSSHQLSMRLCHSLPPHWHFAFRREWRGNAMKQAELDSSVALYSFGSTKCLMAETY